MVAMSENMRMLSDLYRYNAWANARFFSACATVGASVLQEEALGTMGSIEKTLKHMVGRC